MNNSCFWSRALKNSWITCMYTSGFVSTISWFIIRSLSWWICWVIPRWTITRLWTWLRLESWREAWNLFHLIWAKEDSFTVVIDETVSEIVFTYFIWCSADWDGDFAPCINNQWHYFFFVINIVGSSTRWINISILLLLVCIVSSLVIYQHLVFVVIETFEVQQSHFWSNCVNFKLCSRSTHSNWNTSWYWCYVWPRFWTDWSTDILAIFFPGSMIPIAVN